LALDNTSVPYFQFDQQMRHDVHPLLIVGVLHMLKPGAPSQLGRLRLTKGL
jgi:hypothetical protein